MHYCHIISFLSVAAFAISSSARPTETKTKNFVLGKSAANTAFTPSYRRNLSYTTSATTATSFHRGRNHRIIHTISYSNTLTQLSLKGVQGWDNGNFLDALSFSNNGDDKSSSNTLKFANDEYYRQSAQRADIRQRRLNMMDDGEDGGFEIGGEMEGVPDKLPKPPPVDEENPQGGERFRKMMEQAKMKQQQQAQQTTPVSPTPDVVQQQQQPLQQPPPQTVPVTPDPYAAQQQPMDPQAYYQIQLQAWQQQMTAFAQFCAANPDAASTMSPPPPPPPPQQFSQSPPPQAQPQQQMQQQQQAVPPPQQFQPPQPQSEQTAPDNPRAFLHRPPEGQPANSDAYEISNTADVYLAQLKRDTFVRNKYRYMGDEERANQPMQEQGVKALKGLLSEELIESRRAKQRKEMFNSQKNYDEETQRELRALMSDMHDAMKPSDVVEEEQEPDISTGMSYKKKLEEIKRKRSGAAVVETVKQPEPTVQQKDSPPPKMTTPETESKVETPPPTSPPPPPITTTTQSPEPPTETEDIEPMDHPAVTLNIDPNEKPIGAPSSADSEETRRDIRTVMGLILKHRGGPGFGKGRLNSMDGERLENMFDDVLNMLKEEIGEATAPITPEVAETPAATISDLDDPAIATTSSLPSLNLATLTCVKAAISAYESAPNEGLLMPLRDALLSAASAVNTCIAESEVENARLYEAATQSSSSSVSATMAVAPKVEEAIEKLHPLVVQEEEKKEEEVVVDISTPPSPPPPPSSGGNDYNEERLSNIYNALEAVKGNGKYGVKQGISVDEIAEISDNLIEMRTILMDELNVEGNVFDNNDLGSSPSSDTATDAATTSDGGGGGVSKYQQMLAKAKKEKASNVKGKDLEESSPTSAAAASTSTSDGGGGGGLSKYQQMLAKAKKEKASKGKVLDDNVVGSSIDSTAGTATKSDGDSGGGLSKFEQMLARAKKEEALRKEG